MKVFQRLTVCPYCKTVHPLMTAIIGEGEPDDGDIDLCFFCGLFSVFEGGKLRKPTWKEKRDIRDNSELVAVRRQWLLARMTEKDHGR